MQPKSDITRTEHLSQSALNRRYPHLFHTLPSSSSSATSTSITDATDDLSYSALNRRYPHVFHTLSSSVSSSSLSSITRIPNEITIHNDDDISSFISSSSNSERPLTRINTYSPTSSISSITLKRPNSPLSDISSVSTRKNKNKKNKTTNIK